MENYIKTLKNTDLFKYLSDDELSNILKNSNNKIKEYEKNSIIYMQNEKCCSMDNVLEGLVSIQKINSEGNVLTINDFIKGDAIGGNLLFSIENKYPMIVMAKKQVKMLHVKKDLVIKLCQENERFLISILESLSSNALILSNKISSLSMKTIRQCIIDFLLFESYAQNSKTIKLNMTKKELAEKIGVQRSSLSRELNKMRKDGLIDFDAKYIYIREINMLNKLHVEN